jgi:hypothetical protein
LFEYAKVVNKGPISVKGGAVSAISQALAVVADKLPLVKDINAFLSFHWSGYLHFINKSLGSKLYSQIFHVHHVAAKNPIAL